MKPVENLPDTLRENIFYGCLAVTVVAFPFSEALVSIAAGLLLAQAVILRSWKHKTFTLKSRNSLLLLLSVFGIYILGTLFTRDLNMALYELKKTIFWVILPVAFYLSPRLPEKRLYCVLKIFVLAVAAASLTYLLKILSAGNFTSYDFRSQGFVSHIRFSLQVVFSIIVLAWMFLNRKTLPLRWSKYLIALLFIGLVWFLFILQSLIGLIVLFGVAIISFFYGIFILKRKAYRLLCILVLAVIILAPAWFIASVLKDYYRFEDPDLTHPDRYTPSGNPYEFDTLNKTRENGHLVYVYICHEELRREWNRRSPVKYDDLIGDYPLSIILIRYLSSLGYRKDSAAVASLTERDIELVREGVTNYKSANRLFPVYSRIYETVWEIDNYLNNGDPNNKSLVQRMEYIKASLILLEDNPLFGIGTGNWKRKYAEAYHEMNSKLDIHNQASSHNQYLNYLVKFGMAGFIWILSAILIPFFREGHKKNVVFILFMALTALANFGDANLESHMGLSFFTFFYSLLLWNSTSSMVRPPDTLP